MGAKTQGYRSVGHGLSTKPCQDYGQPLSIPVLRLCLAAVVLVWSKVEFAIDGRRCSCGVLHERVHGIAI